MTYNGAYTQVCAHIRNQPATRHRSITFVTSSGVTRIMRHGITLAILTPSGALVRTDIYRANGDVRREYRGVRDALFTLQWRPSSYVLRSAHWMSPLLRNITIDGSRYERWLKPII